MTTTEIPPQLKPLFDGMQHLFISEDYADLIVTCQGRQWKVHKFCLCAQSDFFHSACSKGFKEAGEGKISLDQDDLCAVGAMIRYFYFFDYDDFGDYTENEDWSDNEDSDGSIHLHPLSLHVRVHVIADKYFVEPLKQLAARNFEARAATQWSMIEFADAVAEIYQRIPGKQSPLKNTVKTIVMEHARQLLDTSTSTGAYFFGIYQGCPELMADITRDLIVNQKNDQTKSYRCPKCGNIFSILMPHGRLILCPQGCGTIKMETWEQSLRAS